MLVHLAVAAATCFATILAQTPANISIHNNCDFAVTYRFDGPGTEGMALIIEPEQIDGALLRGEGQSLKFVTTANPDFSAPVLFDFSIPATEPTRVWYDVSDRAGSPFGVWAVPQPLQCDIVGCPANAQAVCSAARSCASEAHFDVFLCYLPEDVDLVQRLRLRGSAHVQQRIRRSE